MFKISLIIAVILFPVFLSADSAGHLVISEIMISGGSGKTTNEFVELYNPTDSEINLNQWQLVKKTSSGNDYILVDDFGDKVIVPNSYFLIAHPVGYLNNIQPDFYYLTTSSIASNNTVLLINNEGITVDKVGMGTASDYEGETINNPGSNKSIERKARSDSFEENMVEGGNHYFLGNGLDSNNNFNDFNLKSTPEPQNSLSEQEYLGIVVPEIITPAEDSNEVEIIYSNSIQVSELFCNPEGSDDAEFIELYNSGNSKVDLSGWQVGDNSTRRFTITQKDFSSTVIDSKKYLLIPKEISRISLNNTGDAVKIFNPNGDQVFIIEYDKCQENQSYIFIDGAWRWTDEQTPGLVNLFLIQNEKPVAIFELEEVDFKVGEVIQLDASQSSDLDGDTLVYIWDFGNGDIIADKKVEYSYSEIGKYKINLLVRDTKGGENEMSLDVEISNYDFSDNIFINELLPACDGADADCEFIELYNNDNYDINLNGWHLTDLKTIYKFPTDSVISSSGYLMIPRQESKITLNNSGDTIFLIDPNGEIINGVEYGKAKNDLSFSMDGDSWHWTEKITPGGENEIIEADESEVAITSEDNSDPLAIGIAEINEDLLGRLIRVEGEVESAKSTGIYLMDELGNTIRVYIQKKTGIAKPDVEEGDRMVVTGILDKTKAGLRLLPRTEDDIVINKQADERPLVLGTNIENEVISISADNEADQVKTYLFVTLGAVLLAIVGFGIKWYMKKRSLSNDVLVPPDDI